MARVNVEDEARADPRFIILGNKLKTTKFDALARMINVWAFCTEKQTYFLTADTIDALAEFSGFCEHILSEDVALAVETRRGIRVRGTKGRIEWLAKLRENSKKGGETNKAKWNAKRLSKKDPGTEPNDSPLILTPTLAPVLKNKEREALSEENFGECLQAWGQTLQRLGVRKKPELDQEQIARLIQRHGADRTKLALLGAGFEEGSPDYDPKKHVSILRLQKPAVFETFVNLGAQLDSGERQTTKWNIGQC